MEISDLKETLGDSCLDLLAGAPVVFHCHHFNLFLDQTIDDALGLKEGACLRRRAARDAWKHLLSGLVDGMGAETPAERLELTQDIFRAMGHGRISVTADGSGGSAEGEYLHYGLAWKEKYGGKVRRTSPVDAVACGFVAAAVEVAFNTPHRMLSRETHCLAMGAERCSFEVIVDPENAPMQPVVGKNEQILAPLQPGLAEDRIVAINAGLRDFLAPVAGDERGLVDAFGVYVTRHLTNYYNGISFGLIREIMERFPERLPLAEHLLRESGHVCVFNTFGGIMYSPEWDALVGRCSGDQLEVVSGCTAIARALGFGAWSIRELDEDHLILRVPCEYEAPYGKLVGNPVPQASYFLQGAAIAFMRLWGQLDWDNREPLTQELYDRLFRDEGAGWTVEQTFSRAEGNDYTEVVVRRE